MVDDCAIVMSTVIHEAQEHWIWIVNVDGYTLVIDGFLAEYRSFHVVGIVDIHILNGFCYTHTATTPPRTPQT